MLVLGGGQSGKITILKRFATGLYSTSTRMTMGVDFSVHLVQTSDGEQVTLQIWDIGGEEDRFRSMFSSFCLGASGALLFYDPFRPETLLELQNWLPTMREYTRNIPVVLVSTQQDLIEEGHLPVVDESVAIEFLSKFNIDGYISVSARTGENIKNAFVGISELMIENKNGIAYRHYDVWEKILLQNGFKLRNWNPTEIIAKLNEGTEITEAEIQNINFRKRIYYILEKIENIDNPAANHFRDFATSQLLVKVGPYECML
jgi:small GTP-binding protein